MSNMWPLVAGSVIDIRFPEIDAADLIVRDPERLMMWMIVSLALDFRPGWIRASHRATTWPHDRPKRGRLTGFGEIFSEQLAIDLDNHAALAALGRNLRARTNCQ